MEMVDRFQMAYQHLYNTGMVHAKKELAALMGVARGSVQKAFAGEEAYLTESFIRKFAGTFSGTFNVDWLLRGEGEMLVQRAPSAAMPQSDVVAQLIRMCNDLHADVRELKQELAATKAEVEKLKRAHYGYASVAADGMSGIEVELEKVK